MESRNLYTILALTGTIPSCDRFDAVLNMEVVDIDAFMQDCSRLRRRYAVFCTARWLSD